MRALHMQLGSPHTHRRNAGIHAQRTWGRKMRTAFWSGLSTAETAKHAYTAPDAPRLKPPRPPIASRPSSEA